MSYEVAIEQVTKRFAAENGREVIALRDNFLHDTGAFIPYGIAIAQVASVSTVFTHTSTTSQPRATCVQSSFV